MEVMERIRDADFDLTQLASWASKMLLEFGAERGMDRKALNRLNPEFLSYIRLSRNTFSRSQKAIQEEPMVDLSRKKGAL